jgi:hypothetical protein
MIFSMQLIRGSFIFFIHFFIHPFIFSFSFIQSSIRGLIDSFD